MSTPRSLRTPVLFPRPSARHLRQAASLLLVFCVAGCAGRTGTGPDVHELADARRVYAAAYDTIADRALEPVRIRDVALEGLHGLATLDGAFETIEQNGQLSARLWGREFAAYPVPGANDAEGWAALTANIAAAARQESPTLGKATADRVMEAVFDGALARLDIYSRYATPGEARHNRDQRNGFGGLGLRFEMKDDGAVVTALDRNGPAEKAGLRIGDLITHVDDTPLDGLLTDEASDLLRGAVLSRARLLIQRRGGTGPLAFMVVREHVVPETVQVRHEPGLSIFRVTSFNQKTAQRLSEEIENAIADRGPDLKGIVLDLRGNPGGLLQQSVQAAELFLAGGDVIATYGRHPDSNHLYAARGRDITDGRPLIILVDGQSASAAEILAAALQDRRRAVVVGTVTYGKGTVQTVVALPNGGEMSLTWSRLVTPGGYALQGLGVDPLLCTSGTIDDGAAALLRGREPQVLARQSQARAAWQTSVGRDAGALRELRNICPPERRRSGTELGVARTLLFSPDRYADALALLAAPATASRPENVSRAP